VCAREIQCTTPHPTYHPVATPTYSSYEGAEHFITTALEKEHFNSIKRALHFYKKELYLSITKALLTEPFNSIKRALYSYEKSPIVSSQQPTQKSPSLPSKEPCISI